MVRVVRVGLICSLFVTAACSEPEEPHRKPDTPDTDLTDTDVTDTDTDTDPPGTTDTGPPTETGDTDATPVFDCATIPEMPLSIAPVLNARGYHGLAFTSDDKLVGSDNTVLIKVDSAGVMEMISPSLGMLQQIVRIDDVTDDLAVAVSTNGTISRVTPAGAVSVIASDVYAYGLTRGPDGMLYAANQSEIIRIDPTTGDKTVVVGGNFGPKVVDFNREGTVMYFGTTGQGEVYQVDLDANYDPTGAPHLLVTGVGTWHDGLGVDACGNVYVADYGTRSTYRISVNGTVDAIFEPADTDFYGHGLIWGPATGGWKDTALYVPQPYNDDTVAEIDIGVPSRTWKGDVVGVVPF